MVELLNQALAKILDGPDYFWCEQLNTKMTKRRCIQRQEAGRWDCRRCEQGKKVKEEGEKVRGEEGDPSEMHLRRSRLRGISRGKEEEGKMEHTVNEQGMVVESSDGEKTLRCRACGKDKPLKEMVPNKRCRDGCEKICKICRRDENKENYRLRKKINNEEKGKVKRRKKQGRPGKRLEVKIQTSPKGYAVASREQGAEDPFIFILSGLMADNPEIRDGLIKKAKEEYRDPEGQAMWYIKRGLAFDRMKKVAAKARGEE